MKIFLFKLQQLGFLFVIAVNTVSPATAANIYFTPSGSQLDDDPINDIRINPSQPITFTVYADITGKDLINGNLITDIINKNQSGATELDFVLENDFDPTELKFVDVTSTKFKIGANEPTTQKIAEFLFNTVNPGMMA